MQDFINQALTMKKDLPLEAVAMMPQLINSVLYVLLGFGILLFIHISLSLSFIKTRAQVFTKE